MLQIIKNKSNNHFKIEKFYLEFTALRGANINICFFPYFHTLNCYHISFTQKCLHMS